MACFRISLPMTTAGVDLYARPLGPNQLLRCPSPAHVQVHRSAGTPSSLNSSPTPVTSSKREQLDHDWLLIEAGEPATIIQE
ncbi:hypothetical protein BD311DRAFT_378679 [Dichomitus squalens]|uniref:Uncharacterized protein n=1 Tax=Dichomitus squalens TaxID=114155 RepID=A0A4Q9MN18_9APHY|nr:hypothetical protein BD311DRAFT_378679 [Dichomitus squalens]